MSKVEIYQKKTGQRLGVIDDDKKTVEMYETWRELQKMKEKKNVPQADDELEEEEIEDERGS